VKRLPTQFEDLLSPRGQRLCRGQDRSLRALQEREPGRRFWVFEQLLRPRAASAVLTLLETQLAPLLSRIDAPIPPAATWGQTRNYEERLPKSARVSTAMLESPRAKAYHRAEELGLVQLLRSESFGAFARALSGRPLLPRWGIQALRYGVGDYAGPHNDHHPEDAESKDGYLDVHWSLSSTGVLHQWLVYERHGHLSELANVVSPSTLTAYRLPFWHYTTPLAGKPGAHRWVLLGTFLYDEQTAVPSTARRTRHK
jgi:hypothetical protein